MTTTTRRLTVNDQQFHCSMCRKAIAGDNRTAHLREVHPEVFAASWASIEAAAARFRSR